jgi:hypothetical protein
MLAIGECTLAIGKCMLAIGECTLAIGKCMLAIGECMLAIGECMLAIGECMLAIGECTLAIEECTLAINPRANARKARHSEPTRRRSVRKLNTRVTQRNAPEESAQPFMPRYSYLMPFGHSVLHTQDSVLSTQDW